MAKKRRRRVERSLLEKHEDALADFALYQNDVRNGSDSWLSGSLLWKLILCGSVVGLAALLGLTFFGAVLGW